MIKGRPGPHAIEFLDAGEDPLDALIVGEMRDVRLSHASLVNNRQVRSENSAAAPQMVGVAQFAIRRRDS